MSRSCVIHYIIHTTVLYITLNQSLLCTDSAKSEIIPNQGPFNVFQAHQTLHQMTKTLAFNSPCSIREWKLCDLVTSSR